MISKRWIDTRFRYKSWVKALELYVAFDTFDSVYLYGEYINNPPGEPGGEWFNAHKKYDLSQPDETSYATNLERKLYILCRVIAEHSS